MKVVNTKTLKLSFQNHLLTCEILKDVEIEAVHTEENYLATLEITGGEKFLCLVIPSPFSTVSTEAQKASMTPEKYENVVAQAIIIHSLAQRIVANFMIKFFKYPCPCRLFDGKEEAVKWLYGEWEKENRG